MQFLVLCLPAARGEAEELKRLVPFETEVLQEQKANGTLTGAWTRPDRVPCSCSKPPTRTRPPVSSRPFPLDQADEITTEIIPMHPIEL